MRTLLFLFLTFFPFLASADKAYEQSITGFWAHEKGPTDFEAFSLETQNEKKLFRSWLHDRPSLDGSWDLAGKNLKIQFRDIAEATNAEILKVTIRTLELKFEGEEEVSVFGRRGE